jgi:hypothetical protein
MNFYNNVIPVLSKIQEKAKEPKNKDTFLKAYKNLAKSYQSIKNADLMNNSIFIDKNWELLDYFDLFSVAAPASIINHVNTNSTSANIREFKLSHHTQYNFMRQEQVGNRKLLNTDFLTSFEGDIASVYYNLKRFQNDNCDLIKLSSGNKTTKRKTDNPDEAKYILDKSYCKIMDKITELLN